MALPITLDEIRPQLKAMFLPLNNDMEVKYTLVHINNQFKIVGTFTSSAHISTFTLDLQQNIPRQFIYEDLHNIIKYMKHSFQDTIFYYLNQIHYRILETLAQIQQSYPHIVDQLVTQPTTQPVTQILDTHSTFPQPATQPATQILDTYSTFPQPATQNPDTHRPFPCCPRTPSPLAILQAYQPQSSQQQNQPNHIFSKPTGTPRRKKFKIQHIPPHTQTM